VLREKLRRIAGDRRVAAARDALDELAPIWWLARAYVAVAAVAIAAGVSWSFSHPLFPRFGNAAAGIALLVAVAVASLWLGGRRRRGLFGARAMRALLALDGALVILLVPVAYRVATESAAARPVVVVAAAAPVGGLAYDGVRVDNVYPFSRDGRLLHDVLLFDGAGRPLEIGGPATADPDRRPLLARDGRQVYNAFPIRYFEPGTQEVAHPDAIPPVAIPDIVTPPLAGPR